MKKILLIDDSDTYTWCLQKYLQHRGYPVKTACTLKEARAAIQEEMPLVVCCNLDLPDGSGMDFLNEVRAAGRLPSSAGNCPPCSWSRCFSLSFLRFCWLWGRSSFSGKQFCRKDWCCFMVWSQSCCSARYIWPISAPRCPCSNGLFCGLKCTEFWISTKMKQFGLFFCRKKWALGQFCNNSVLE